MDAHSCERYEQLPGELGERLRAAILYTDEGASFRLTEDERCPFLRADGLCELICRLGEESLCEICRLHPRFYEELGDWRLCGLGLSCEAACALLLDGSGPLRFAEEESGESLTLPQLLRRLGIELPEAALRFVPAPSAAYYEALLERFAATEPIDTDWTEQLAELRRCLAQATASAAAYAKDYPAERYDRIFAYILYRQLERVEEYGAESLAEYARLCTEFVFLCDAWSGDTAEALRRFSEQIEYSTENVDLLLCGE